MKKNFYAAENLHNKTIDFVYSYAPIFFIAIGCIATFVLLITE